MNSPTADVIRNLVLSQMNPQTLQNERVQAFNMLDKFKRSSYMHLELLAPLCDFNEDPQVRHFAIKSIESAIMFGYNEMSDVAKIELKQLCLQLINSCVRDITVEERFIKDAFSRIIVELAKREWPQLWTGFFNDLDCLCSTGKLIHLEVVMLILLRLSEDIILDNIKGGSADRRKELVQTLTLSLPETIIPCVLNKLEQFTQILVEKSRTGESGVGELILSKSILDTVMGIFSFCDPDLSTFNDNKLIQILFSLLTHPDLQLAAAECLLVMTQCDPAKKYSKLLDVLFTPGCITELCNAASEANKKSMFDENYYNFLRRITQLVVGMGLLVVTQWEKDKTGEFSPPNSMISYIDILFEFCNIPSYIISHDVLEFFVKLLKTSNNKNNIKLIKHITPTLSIICRDKFKKRGGPEDKEHPGYRYSVLDHDDQDEWSTLYYKCKGIMVVILNICLQHSRLEMVCESSNHVQQLLQQTITSYSADKSYTQSDELVTEWNGSLLYFHVITTDLHKHIDILEQSPFLLTLLNLTIQHTDKFKDPIFTDFMLTLFSCLSCVCILPENNEVIMDLLTGIFSVVQIQPDSAQYNRDNTQHACHIFTKLSKTLTDVLVPYFEMIHRHIESLKTTAHTQWMRGLYEGLLVISNKMTHRIEQENYVLLVTKQYLDFWNEPAVQSGIKNVESLVEFIDLWSPPPTDYQIHLNSQKNTLLGSLKFFEIVTKTIIAPEGEQTRITGGYRNEQGHVITACTHLFMPLLDSMLLCLNSYLGLYKPGISQTFHSDNSKALQLVSYERMSILRRLSEGWSGSKDNDEIYQKHIMHSIIMLSQTLSGFIKNQPAVVFSHTNFIDKICLVISDNIHHTPHYSTRHLLKPLLKTVIQSAPTEYQLTLVTSLCNSVLINLAVKLDSMWTSRGEIDETSEEERYEAMEDEEVVEEILLRQVSRDVAELLNFLILQNTNKPNPNTTAHDDVNMEPSETSPSLPVINPRTITGSIRLVDVIKSLSLDHYEFLLRFCLQAATWPDVNTSTKCCNIAQLMIVEIRSTLAPDMCQHVIVQCLESLHRSGSDQLITSNHIHTLVDLYEAAVTTNPAILDCIRRVFKQINGITDGQLRNFENFITPVNKDQQKPMKSKKNALKKLLAPVFKNNLSESYKEKFIISNLPPLTKYKLKPVTDSILLSTDDHDSLALCQLFNPQSVS